MQYIYLHGFLSGPTAFKATLIKNYLQDHQINDSFEAPDYPDLPLEAYNYLDAYFKAKQGQDFLVIGSSMGGFFATLFHSIYNFKAVLLNPCVHPQEYFRDLIGDHENPVTGRKFTLIEPMIETLKSLDEKIVLNKESLMVYLQDGDEVLDYLKGVKFYKGCHIDIQGGGDHGMTNFATYLPQIIK